MVIFGNLSVIHSAFSLDIVNLTNFCPFVDCEMNGCSLVGLGWFVFKIVFIDFQRKKEGEGAWEGEREMM